MPGNDSPARPSAWPGNPFRLAGADVAAGVRHPGLRLLDGRFMVIRQAMGLPKSRGPEATAFLAAFVESMKADGAVAAALARHGIEGASVAPAE